MLKTHCSLSCQNAFYDRTCGKNFFFLLIIKLFKKYLKDKVCRLDGETVIELRLVETDPSNANPVESLLAEQ